MGCVEKSAVVVVVVGAFGGVKAGVCVVGKRLVVVFLVLGSGGCWVGGVCVGGETLGVYFVFDYEFVEVDCEAFDVE